MPVYDRLGLGLLLLTISACMLGTTAWMVARSWSSVPADRYWLCLAVVLMQLGAYALVLSWLEALALRPFLGLQAIVLLVLAGPAMLRRLKASRRDGCGLALPAMILHVPPPPVRWVWADPLRFALVFAIGGFLVLSGSQQWLTPIAGHDERMYHLPRVLYWIQNQSIFPFETHNDRQTVFPFAAELSAAWCLLFVKDELPVRMVFWLAFPATAIGMYLVARQVRVPHRYALAAVLLYVSTPTVLRHAASLKPDAWQALFALGLAYFMARGLSGWQGASRQWASAGVLAACAMAVKTTSLALVPGVAVVAASRMRLRSVALSIACLAAGCFVAAVLTGFASLMWWNVRDHGAPLGPAPMTRLHQPVRSVEQIATHAARVPLYLFELPDVTEYSRLWLLERKERATEVTGAGRRLHQEDEQGWPGLFRATLPGRAQVYSIGGLLWLPILLVGTLRVLRELRRLWTGRRPVFSRVGALVVLQVPLLLGVVFAVRWMGGAPDRFWLASYALAVPVMAYFFARWSRRWPFVGGLALLLLIWGAYPSLRERIAFIEHAVHHPLSAERLDEPYQLVTPHLDAGDVVLLFANQGSRDYGLFGPRRGYTTRVIPWGKGAFEEDRLLDRLEQHQVTHVLFEHHIIVGFIGVGHVRAVDFVRWFEQNPEFELVPIVAEPDTTPMRLFRRREIEER